MASTPLNESALEVAFDSVSHPAIVREDMKDIVTDAVSAYLAAAQQMVTTVDPSELNRRGWTCGCEPGNYDTCDECQSACNELAGFLNRPEATP